MRVGSIITLAATSALSLSGLACHHSDKHRDRNDPVVLDDRRPQYDHGQPIYYDEGGGRIRDPHVIERVRYYDASPQYIERRDNEYYYRGSHVTDRDEIRAIQLEQLHHDNRVIKDERYRDAKDDRRSSDQRARDSRTSQADRDRAEKDKRADLDRAEKDKRAEYDRAEKAKRDDLDRQEKQARDAKDRAEKQQEASQEKAREDRDRQIKAGRDAKAQQDAKAQHDARIERDAKADRTSAPDQESKAQRDARIQREQDAAAKRKAAEDAQHRQPSQNQ